MSLRKQDTGVARAAAARRRQRVTESKWTQETSLQLQESNLQVENQVAELLSRTARKAARPKDLDIINQTESIIPLGNDRFATPLPSQFVPSQRLSQPVTHNTINSTDDRSTATPSISGSVTHQPTSRPSTSVKSVNVDKNTASRVPSSLPYPHTSRPVATISNISRSIDTNKITASHSVQPLQIQPTADSQLNNTYRNESPIFIESNKPVKSEDDPVYDVDTIDDIEPSFEDSSKVRIDASCLGTDKASCNVMIVSNQLGRTCVANEGKDNENSISCAGLMLDRVTESWTVNIIKSKDTKVLHYGDIILLQRGNKQALGVHIITTTTTESTPDSTHEVTLTSTAYRDSAWQVIRAVPEVPLRVGNAAKESRRLPKSWTSAVSSGDPILLRHWNTGGILSVDTIGKLILLTDSYVSNEQALSDNSTLARLRSHGLFVPRCTEVFHFVQDTTPPLPVWTLTGKDGWYSRRCNLEGFVESSKDISDLEGINLLVNDDTIDDTVYIEELLGSFAGLDGNLFRIQERSTPNDVHFVQQSTSSVNTGVSNVVQNILKLSTNYIKIKRLISSKPQCYEKGYIVHAVFASVCTILDEYLSFISSIEQKYRQGHVNTLKHLQVIIRPAVETISQLALVLGITAHSKGGALLNILHSLKVKTVDGNYAAESILNRLLKSATKPYLNMLTSWLDLGKLNDPYGEFMITMNEEKDWNSRYAVNSGNVPWHLLTNRGLVTKVLTTGRYWNSLRACHHKVLSEKIDIEPYCLDTCNDVSSHIEKMHTYASQALTKVLLLDYDLLGSLHTIKRYFLLDQGDFFVNFFEKAEEELRKKAIDISQGRVQHWLSSSVMLTEQYIEVGVSSDDDKNRHANTLNSSQLRSRFAKESLVNYIEKRFDEKNGTTKSSQADTPAKDAKSNKSKENCTGVEAIYLDMSSITFPLSIVLSQDALSKYQLLFRHLFYAKYVEHSLVEIWRNHQAMKELQSIRGSIGPTFLLRQRMLHFVQNFIYYMMLEIIEPKWEKMQHGITEEGINGDSNVDHIITFHNTFLDESLEACLLTNKDLVRASSKLMATCLLFADQMKLFFESTNIDREQKNVANEKNKRIQQVLNDRGGGYASSSLKAVHESLRQAHKDRAARVRRQTIRVEREIANDTYKTMVARFDEVFSINLSRLMTLLTDTDDSTHVHKMNLCSRIDYNGYVSKSIGLDS